MLIALRKTIIQVLFIEKKYQIKSYAINNAKILLLIQMRFNRRKKESAREEINRSKSEK